MHDPREEYKKRLDAHLEVIASRERQHVRLGNTKLGVVVAALVMAWLSFVRHLFPAWWLAVPLGIYTVLAILHERVIRARIARGNSRIRLSQRHRANRRPLDRHGCVRRQIPRRQTRICKRPRSLWPGCVFELLSTARMPMGENRLAEWLKQPSPVAAIVERQGLVAELRPKLDLREDLAVTGEEAAVAPQSRIADCMGRRKINYRPACMAHRRGHVCDCCSCRDCLPG